MERDNRQIGAKWLARPLPGAREPSQNSLLLHDRWRVHDARDMPELRCRSALPIYDSYPYLCAELERRGGQRLPLLPDDSAAAQRHLKLAPERQARRPDVGPGFGDGHDDEIPWTAPTDATRWGTRSMARRTRLSRSAARRIWRAFALDPTAPRSRSPQRVPCSLNRVRDSARRLCIRSSNSRYLCPESYIDPIIKAICFVVPRPPCAFSIPARSNCWKPAVLEHRWSFTRKKLSKSM